MSSQISAPVRIVALIGVLCAVAMGTWMTLSSAGKGGSADVAGATPLSVEAQANAVAAKLNSHNVKTAAGKPDATSTAAAPKAKAKVKAATAAPKPVTAATHAAAPAPKAKVAAKPKTAAVKLPAGTPHTIAGQLAAHQVVVVLLYNPTAKVDSYSLGEALLGARTAGAGFLRVNVLDQAQALPFSKAYGVLQDPTILFFVRPGTLVQKLVGFADHETISQAAANAALGARASS
jgi:hypothetical protein